MNVGLKINRSREPLRGRDTYHARRLAGGVLLVVTLAIVNKYKPSVASCFCKLRQCNGQETTGISAKRTQKLNLKRLLYCQYYQALHVPYSQESAWYCINEAL